MKLVATKRLIECVAIPELSVEPLRCRWVLICTLWPCSVAVIIPAFGAGDGGSNPPGATYFSNICSRSPRLLANMLTSVGILVCQSARGLCNLIFIIIVLVAPGLVADTIIIAFVLVCSSARGYTNYFPWLKQVFYSHQLNLELRIMVMDILFTGFEPFGRWKVNPSWQLVNKARGVRKLILPVDTDKVNDFLDKSYAKHVPSVVVHFGLHGRGRIVHLERFAVNLLDFRIPDNAGNKTSEEPIDKKGPMAYKTRMPLKDLKAALMERGIKSKISNTAGTYLCNQVYYHSHHYFDNKGLDIPVLFIHIPNTRYFPEEKYLGLADGVLQFVTHNLNPD